MTMATGGRK